jgi:hypothetical protein
VFTWLSGKQGREHAAEMAREERTQQRPADTYVALLDMAERVGMWAQMVRPLLDEGSLCRHCRTSPSKPR